MTAAVTTFDVGDAAPTGQGERRPPCRRQLSVHRRRISSGGGGSRLTSRRSPWARPLAAAAVSALLLLLASVTPSTNLLFPSRAHAAVAADPADGITADDDGGGDDNDGDPAHYLALGDESLASRDDPVAAAEHYLRGLEILEARTATTTGKNDGGSTASASEAALMTELSLRTNYGTALSSVEGSTPAVLEAYRSACRVYEGRAQKKRAAVDGSDDDDARWIASQAYHFLGMTHHDLGRLREAAMAYGRAAELDLNHWSALANLGGVLGDMAAASSVEAKTDTEGEDGEGGGSSPLGALAMIDESIQAYQAAIDVLEGGSSSSSASPTDPPENPREVLSELHSRVGSAVADAARVNPRRKCATRDDPTKARSCGEAAAHEFNAALRLDPGNAGARDELNAMTADAGPMFGGGGEAGADGIDHAEYVRGLFEGYADSFEHSLVHDLKYDGFHRMRDGFDRALAKASANDGAPPFETVIDAGCGTGLAGEVFRNISRTLIGIDLSPSIIERAKQARPGLYDNFVVGDVAAAFRARDNTISLIVAADAYIYFSDLNDLFDAMSTGLEDGGYAVFSMENVSLENEGSLNKVKPHWRWQLTPSGRFAHRKDYVESVGEAHSLRVFHYEKLDDFREESGAGVRGHMFVMQRMNREGRDKEL